MSRRRSLLAAVCILSALPTTQAQEIVEVGFMGRVLPAEKTTNPTDRNQTAAGELYVEPSTLHSLGFEWNIDGDDDRDGRVAVHYRLKGTADWREALGLLRIHGERVGFNVGGAEPEKHKPFTCGNLYAGSILFLEPGTNYDVRLELLDPDNGDKPVAVHNLVVSTKPEPQRYDGGRKLHVYPADHSGSKESPAFDDLAAAYKQTEPGDQVTLHAGTYVGGAYVFDRKGARERPIVICAAGDGPVIFIGDRSGKSGKVVTEPIMGTDDVHWHDGRTLFDVSRAKYHWFEGLTVRNYNQAIECADAGATLGLTVRRCTFEDSGWAAILLRSPLCRDVLIADNTFRGTQGTWFRKEQKQWPYKGPWVSGQGVDVCYNLCQNHKDGISVFGEGRGESFDRKIAAIDFHHNDVGQSWDDNEADGGQHNIRFFLNRFVDQHVGLSAQPIYGGPCYFVRNVQYNVTRGVVFKTNVQPAGVVALHNTSFSTKNPAGITAGYSNCHFLNNAFFGLSGPTFDTGPFDPEISRIDYNGYTPTDPPAWITFDETLTRKKVKTYKSLADLAAKTGFEQHGVLISFDDVVGAPPPPGEAKTHVDLNFGDPRPKPGSKLIDAALRLPNINDDFAGDGPDLGAFEAGKPLPHYGPRE